MNNQFRVLENVYTVEWQKDNCRRIFKIIAIFTIKFLLLFSGTGRKNILRFNIHV